MQAKTERFEMRLDLDILERVDDWRRNAADDFPSRSEAVRRLISVGLAGSESTRNAYPEFSDEGKLMLLMLSDIYEKLGIKGEVNPDFLKDVLYGGHYWALQWENNGLFHKHRDSDRALRETVDILDMWTFIEDSFKNLSEEDQKAVTGNSPLERLAPLSFPGFDGNNETEHRGIARVLVEKLHRFQSLGKRAYGDCHHPVLDGYRSMLSVFAPLRALLVGRLLSASEITAILKARHPRSPLEGMQANG